MEAPVPVSIQPLIDAYLQALEPLRTHFNGIYIACSIAVMATLEIRSKKSSNDSSTHSLFYRGGIQRNYFNCRLETARHTSPNDADC